MRDLFETFQAAADNFARGLSLVDDSADIEHAAEMETKATKRAVALGESPCDLPEWLS